jgi:hypothetical protein
MEIDHPLLPELKRIYQEVSKWPGFPKEWCKDVSGKVQRELGLRTKDSWFLLDFAVTSFDGYSRLVSYHVCSVDQDENLIDLTASQFNPYLRNPIPSGILILPPENQLCERYLDISTDISDYYYDYDRDLESPKVSIFTEV